LCRLHDEIDPVVWLQQGIDSRIYMNTVANDAWSGWKSVPGDATTNVRGARVRCLRAERHGGLERAALRGADPPCALDLVTTAGPSEPPAANEVASTLARWSTPVWLR